MIKKSSFKGFSSAFYAPTFFSSVALLWCLSFATHQTPTPQYRPLTTPAGTCSPVYNANFQHGEQLTYKIYYNLNFVWVPAGEVTFTVADEGSRYHFSATGETYSSYEWFYKAKNTFDSYVDKTTLLPQTSIRSIQENRYQLYEKVYFDQKNRKASYERGPNAQNINKKGTVNLSECMNDILSTIYYCRTLDYSQAQNGQTFPIKLMLDQQEYPLQYRLEGRENKKVKEIGTYATIKITPQVIAGNVFNEKSKMTIWASDDGNKIPLMIESPVAVGSVKVVLKKYYGLKYPVSSKRG